MIIKVFLELLFCMAMLMRTITIYDFHEISLKVQWKRLWSTFNVRQLTRWDAFGYQRKCKFFKDKHWQFFLEFHDFFVTYLLTNIFFIIFLHSHNSTTGRLGFSFNNEPALSDLRKEKRRKYMLRAKHERERKEAKERNVDTREKI